jgi:hypothetical protein
MRFCACGQNAIDGGPHRYPVVINELKNPRHAEYIQITGEPANIQMVIVDTDLDEKNLMADWNYKVDKYGQFIENKPPKYVNSVKDLKANL